MNLTNIATVISLVTGLLGFLSGLVLWYRGAVEKRYAAERDFAHLKNNISQLFQAIESLADDIEEIEKKLDEVLDIK